MSMNYCTGLVLPTKWKKTKDQEISSRLSSTQRLQLHMIRIHRIRQRLIRSPEALRTTNSLRNHSIDNKNQHHNNNDMNHEREIEDRNGSKLRFIELTLGGPLYTTHNIKQPMTSLGNESLNVERESGLQGPESLEADRGGEGDIGGEEAGEESEGEG